MKRAYKTTYRTTYKSAHLGSKLKPFYATIEATGNGSGVSTMRVVVDKAQIFTLEGAARFYTDSEGTLNESVAWDVTPGALRTIYIKCTSGTSKMFIPSPENLIKLGGSTVANSVGYAQVVNSPLLNINISKTQLSELYLLSGVKLSGFYNQLEILYTGTASLLWQIQQTLPSVMTYLRVQSSDFIYDSSEPLPEALTYLQINSTGFNWTGLSIPGNSNITTLLLQKYRQSKMSSADMVTFLTNLTNRVGGLPSSITINDYADYASPPQSVIDAVAALKTAKNVTTVNLGA